MEFYKPIGRAVKYDLLKWWAGRRIDDDAQDLPAEAAPSMAFFIGCGRSGTTVLGEVFDCHPEVKYFYEPYHLWATIDPATDVTNRYQVGPAHFLMDASDATAVARRRFQQLILRPTRRARRQVAIEKTPHNACRIGYLESLQPGSKYIHLIRDGVDVCRSIDRLSRDKTFRMAGRPGLNLWWGRHGSKWIALAADGTAAGYFPDEVARLQSYESKGAYEWVVSLGEVERARPKLGDRLMEMSYQRLTDNPAAALTEICQFLGLSVPPRWLEQSATRIEKARTNPGKPLVLPPRICQSFNEWQERYGFAGRAVAGEPRGRTVHVALISAVPTPYRLHVLDRLAKELSDVQIHNIFTHKVSNPIMPWQMEIAPHLNPVLFPRHHLKSRRPISWRCLPLFRDIRQYLRRQDVRLIILLGYNDLVRLLLIPWARRAGIATILTSDSNIFSDAHTSGWVRWLKQIYVRWVLHRIAGLMPMGTCGRAYFRHYLDHDLPEFLFPYEPDYAALKHPSPEALEAFRQKHRLTTPQRRRLLYCGRLVKIKRVDLLLAAFARVAEARPQWDLVIVGTGPLRAELEAAVPAPLRDRVKWLGFQQFDQIVNAYHTCDVLVHPSEFEPWGLVINEAIACGLPIVTTSVVGAAVELVRHRHNGLIVPPRNVAALADAISEITQEDRYLAMRRRCASVLEDWRRSADPIDGFHEALRYFGLEWQQAAGPAQSAQSSPPVQMSPADSTTGGVPAKV
jgi:glycosyltransferase involved in cell wall biosynthesis